jgi:hypothetical protein
LRDIVELQMNKGEMMKIFANILASVIFFSSMASAQKIDIGRAAVTFPIEGEWIEVGQNSQGTNYSGDVSGTTTAESKTYVALNSNKEWVALVTVRASKSSVANATISWTGGCKGTASQVVFDFTNGSPVRNDCLKVLKNVKGESFVSQASLKVIKDSLDSKNLVLNGPAFLVNHMVGTQSGTFVATSALISHKALKKVAGANAGEAFAGQPGVAWGHLMAAEARSSANSMRGRMTIPSLE